MIPQYNDSERIIVEMAQSLASVGDAIERFFLLPYHPFGSARYLSLGKDDPFKGRGSLDNSSVDRFNQVFREFFPAEKIQVGKSMVHG